MFSLRASLVQLVERRSPKPDVGGSSPPGRASPFFTIFDLNIAFTQDCKGIARVAAMTKNELKEQPKELSKADSGSSPDGSGVAKFFTESKAEFGKIVWPTRQQLISESVAVLLMIVAVATFVYLIDALFRTIALQVFQ